MCLIYCLHFVTDWPIWSDYLTWVPRNSCCFAIVRFCYKVEVVVYVDTSIYRVVQKTDTRFYF